MIKNSDTIYMKYFSGLQNICVQTKIFLVASEKSLSDWILDWHDIAFPSELAQPLNGFFLSINLQ